MSSRGSAVKRIMSEMKEMSSQENIEFSAAPTEVRRSHVFDMVQDNLFEWHFTLRGPQDTVFEKGMYHGKIILPSEYPFKAPHVIFLTPNGRWALDTKVS